jgi:CRP-like cAMP-binding protein
LVTIDSLKEGDIFGELGFLEGGKRLRSASVIASGDVWVGILDGAKLSTDYEMLPYNLRALIRSLVVKLREITANVCSMASVQDDK